VIGFFWSFLLVNPPGSALRTGSGASWARAHIPVDHTRLLRDVRPAFGSVSVRYDDRNAPRVRLWTGDDPDRFRAQAGVYASCSSSPPCFHLDPHRLRSGPFWSHPHRNNCVTMLDAAQQGTIGPVAARACAVG